MDISGLVSDFAPVVFVGMFVYMMVKPLIKWLKNRNSKKVDRPRSEADRLYIGMKKAAKSTSLGKHVPVKCTGDEGTPETKLGETIAGVVRGNDEVFMFLRSRWWKAWEEAFCLRVAPELVGDLNIGEIVIKGKALDPVSDRYMYIEPPSQYFDDIDVDKVYERRSKVASLKFKRLLDMDIDEDRSFVVKSALRGGSKRALKEVYMPNKPPKENKDKVEREKKRKADEMQKEYEESGGTQSQQQMMGAGNQ